MDFLTPIRVLRIVFITLLAFAIDALDPFKLRSKSDSVSREAFESLYSPFYSNIRRLGQENIVVLLIDEVSLQRLHWRYALDYLDHAAYLGALLPLEPKAIFLDFSFLAARPSPEGEGMSDLARILGDYAEGYPKTSIVIGTAAQAKIPEEFTLLQNRDLVSFAQVRWSAYGDNYPLHPDPNASISSPAYLLYEEFCALERSKCNLNYAPDANPRLSFVRPPQRTSLSVVWGATFPDSNRQLYPNTPCLAPGKRDIKGRIDLARRLFLSSLSSSNSNDKPSVPVTCPYHTTILVQDLFSMLDGLEGRQILRRLVEGRVVLVGVHQNVSNDFVISPVHGQLPGVYYHAMALDNLIEYKDRYYRDPPSIVRGFDFGDLAALLAIITALIFSFYYKDRIGQHIKNSDSFTWLRGLFVYALPPLLCVVVVLSLFFQAAILRWTPSNWLGVLGAITIFYLAMLSRVTLDLTLAWVRPKVIRSPLGAAREAIGGFLQFVRKLSFSEERN